MPNLWPPLIYCCRTRSTTTPFNFGGGRGRMACGLTPWHRPFLKTPPPTPDNFEIVITYFPNANAISSTHLLADTLEGRMKQ